MPVRRFLALFTSSTFSLMVIVSLQVSSSKPLGVIRNTSLGVKIVPSPGMSTHACAKHLAGALLRIVPDLVKNSSASLSVPFLKAARHLPHVDAHYSKL